MNTFIDRLVEEIKTLPEKDFSRIQVVFPTRRACSIFKSRFAKHFSTPQWLPGVCSIEDFILLNVMPVADDMILLLELFKANQNINPTEEFENFYQWGQILLNDFDEIDSNFADVNKIFATLQNIADVENLFDFEEEQLNWMKEFWQTLFGRNENEDDLRNRFLHNWKNIPKLYALFQKSLSEKNLSYRGLAYRNVAEDFQQNKVQLKYSTIVFAGFYALSKSEEAIINHLTKNGIGHIFWDADSYYTDTKLHEAGAYIRNNKINNAEIKWKGDYFASIPKNISFSAVVQHVGQAKYLGVILEKLLKQGELDIENTVIVLPDEHLLLPVLNSLPQELNSINVTMGFPLKQTGLFSFLNSFLNVLKEKKVSKENVLFSKILLREMMNHSFIKHDIEKEFPDFFSAFENLFAGYINVSKLNEQFQHPLFELLSKNKNQLIEIVSSSLEIIKQINADLLSPFEKEAFNYFNDSINNLKNTIAGYNTLIDERQVIVLLKNELRNLRIPFIGEPVKGLQIMGFLESRLLDFDRVFMLSMNEGILPATKNIKSYIPYSIRKAFGLQTHENNDAISSHHFYRLMQRAGNVHLFYNSYNGKGDGEPSRYLLQIEHELLKLKNITLTKQTISTPIQTYDDKSITIKKDDALIKILNEKFTGEKETRKKLSPTSLTSYIACPLRFYFSYVAQIPQPDEFDDTIEGALLGTILHNSMEELYGNTTEVTTSFIDSIIPKIEAVIDKNLLAEFPKAKLGLEGKNILTRKILINLVLKILNSDKLLAPFKVLQVEDTLTHEINLNNKINATVYGKIDRTDQLGNAIRIVDYKTGRVNELNKSDDMIESVFETPDYKEIFQLLMYALLSSKKYPGKNLQAAFYQLRQMSGGMKFLMNGENISQELLQQFENKLSELIKEILNPEIDFYQTPKIERCTYCAYKDICHK